MMKIKVQFKATLFLIIISFSHNSFCQEVTPLETFFKTSNESKISVSPSGRHLGYLAPFEQRNNLFIRNVITDETVQITKYTDQNVRNYSWFNDSLLLVRVDHHGDENYHLILYNRHGDFLRDLTPYNRPAVEDVIVRDNSIYLQMEKNSNSKGLFVIKPLTDGDPVVSLIARSMGLIDEHFIVDNNNVVRIVYGIDEKGDRLIYHREGNKDEFKLILKTSTEDQLLPKAFTKDNRLIYCFSNLNRDKFAAVKFDPLTSQEVEVIYKNETYDVNGKFTFSPLNELRYITYTNWKLTNHVLDPKSKNLFKIIEQRFPESNINILSEETNVVLVQISSDINPGQTFIYDKTQNSWKMVSEVNPNLSPGMLSKMHPIQYRTTEGRKIHGYVVQPKQPATDRQPVVVIAHGGPWSRDEWGYNSRYQFLANRGYVVFYMDFRGSRGYGKEHYSSSFIAWDKMNEDIEEGVKWLIDNYNVDKSRISIYGHSWGGYAALYGAVFYPDIYKCAISASGPSDLETFYNRITRGNKELEGIVSKLIGNPQLDSIYFNKNSPLRHVSSNTSPLLIWQGKNDPRVPWEEASQIANKLDSFRIPFKFLLKENEGHNISKEENRFEFYRELELFLEENLK